MSGDLPSAAGQGQSLAKWSAYWDAGREVRTLDPIFKFAVTLSCCGYGLRYWGIGLLGSRAVGSSGTLEHSSGAVRKFPRPENLDLGESTHLHFILLSPPTKGHVPLLVFNVSSTSMLGEANLSRTVLSKPALWTSSAVSSRLGPQVAVGPDSSASGMPRETREQ